jgi:ribose-phosphate pyrophosphokinase
VKGVDALLNAGAKSVTGCATHAVLSGPAIERINRSAIKELVVTNSIPCTAEAAQSGKITVLSVASLLARGIQSIHEGGSISTLFV